MSGPPISHGGVERSPILCHVSLDGTVIKGFGRGRKDIGVPTANLKGNELSDILVGRSNDVNEGQTALTHGVYCGTATLPGIGGPWAAVISVGTNPTYGNEFPSIEVHIIHDFERDFYGAELHVDVRAKIRQMTKMKSLGELRRSIHEDIMWSLEWLRENDFD